jgi:5-methylcytosine-specific restriction endonuclease McrA
MGFNEFESCEQRDARNKKLRRERLQAARRLGTHTKAQWLSLKEEFAYRCVRCGLKGSKEQDFIVKDHIIPIYLGGSDGIDNLQPLCCVCNVQKTSESFNWVEYRRGSGWADAIYDV